MACLPVAPWCGVEGGTFMPRRSIRELSTGQPILGHECVRSHFGARGASHWSIGSELMQTCLWCPVESCDGVHFELICAVLVLIVPFSVRGRERPERILFGATGRPVGQTDAQRQDHRRLQCERMGAPLVIMMTTGVRHHKSPSATPTRVTTTPRHGSGSRFRTIGHGEEGRRRTPSPRRSSTNRRRSTGSWRASGSS